MGAGGFSSSAHLVRPGQGRPARPLRHALRRVVGREGPVLHARRPHQVVLHARVLSRAEPDPLPQQGRRHVRGRDREGGPAQPEGQGAGRGHAGRKRRRLARPVRGQRHAAQQPVPEQRATAPSPTWPPTAGRGLQRGGRGARRHGRGRRRLRPLRPAQHRHRQLLERDDGALPQRGRRPLHRRGAHLGHRPGFDADLELRLLLLRPRPRRLARHLRGQRPRGGRHRARAAARSRYAQPPHLFRNLDGKRFEAVTARLGPALQRPMVAPGRRLRGLRRRRRPRPRAHHQQRARATSCATTEGTGTSGCACAPSARSRTATASARA